MKRRRPFRIVDPCRQDWDALPRTPEGFLCGQCDKTVHDLTQMTRREAEAYRASLAGPICVRLRKGADGEAAFVPEPGPVARAGVGAAALAVALAACGHPEGPSRAQHVTPPVVLAPEPPAPVIAPPPPAPVAPPAPDPGPSVPATPEPLPTPEQAALLRAQHRAAHHSRHAPIRLRDDEILSGGLDAL